MVVGGLAFEAQEAAFLCRRARRARGNWREVRGMEGRGDPIVTT